jgi:hypothetical protein
MQNMCCIGLDVYERTISYCVKDGGGKIHGDGVIPATRFDLDWWMKNKIAVLLMELIEAYA